MTYSVELPIDDQPAYATQLGLLVATWGHIEFELKDFLGWLLGMRSNSVDDVQIPIIIYQHFTSVRSKIDLLTRLAKHRMDRDAQEHAFFLLSESVTLNSERNKFVHSFWGGMGDSNPLAMWQLSLPGNPKGTPFKTSEQITIEELQSAATKARELLSKWSFFRGCDYSWPLTPWWER